MISESFVLLYFRICARRANFSHLETLGFGYSSRQDAKNAKFGNLFFLCVFASLREMFDSFWLRLAAFGLCAEIVLQRGLNMNMALWIVQALLALIFLFSGSMKFVMSVEEMTKQMPMPG